MFQLILNLQTLIKILIHQYEQIKVNLKVEPKISWTSLWIEPDPFCELEIGSPVQGESGTIEK